MSDLSKALKKGADFLSTLSNQISKMDNPENDEELPFGWDDIGVSEPPEDEEGYDECEDDFNWSGSDESNGFDVWGEPSLNNVFDNSVNYSDSFGNFGPVMGTPIIPPHSYDKPQGLHEKVINSVCWRLFSRYKGISNSLLDRRTLLDEYDYFVKNHNLWSSLDMLSDDVLSLFDQSINSNNPVGVLDLVSLSTMGRVSYDIINNISWRLYAYRNLNFVDIIGHTQIFNNYVQFVKNYNLWNELNKLNVVVLDLLEEYVS